jgi:2-polyprenyl-3-methyl-5-hydroxy-6-metoxy-1,4-benzoquinol methylase
MELLEKIRRQFDSAPYPKTPLDKPPQGNPYLLYTHNLVTAHYLRDRRVINPQGKSILDVGCGTGYTSLVLAAANPGTNVVGVDISPVSIELARQRAAHHGYQVEFQVLGISELAQLGQSFDYINCDEVLYLLPDPGLALKTMTDVLQPDGIIRANLHSLYQRFEFFLAQEFFRLVGVEEVDTVRSTMTALKDSATTKVRTWLPSYDDEGITCNYLLTGDQGHTIRNLAALLQQSNLELISMVNWRQWQLESLFSEPDNLPLFLAMAISEMTLLQQLEMFELINPIHRLLDFWCSVRPAQIGWQPNWAELTVHLHPQLVTPEAQEAAATTSRRAEPFLISWYLPLSGTPNPVDSKLTSALLPLWSGPQTFTRLADHWQKLYPDIPIQILQDGLVELDSLGYILLDNHD